MTVYQQIKRMTDWEIREAILRNEEMLTWTKNPMVRSSRSNMNKMMKKELEERAHSRYAETAIVP